MPRSTALDRRYRLLRLVLMTSNHSSSFMRSMRLSRVMPALFTTINGWPRCCWMCSRVLATDSSLLTSRTRPAPSMPLSLRYSAMRSAPEAEVAVPMTTAP
ncbi:hypothetical protein D3C84_1117940 [compost metagenome]